MKIKLEEILKINTAGRIWSAIYAEIEKNPSAAIKIDAAAVKKIDTAGIQLLLYIKKLGRKKPPVCSLTGVSEQIITQIKKTGFSF